MKTVKSIKAVYGDYANYGLVSRIQSTAEQCRMAIIYNRNDKVSKDTCNKDIDSCCRDLEFWEGMIDACKYWRKEQEHEKTTYK